MQRVSIDDPAWRTTFPHPVKPLEDEWLAGLLLRCDEANDWGSGFTISYLFHSIGRDNWKGEVNFIMPPTSIFEKLSQLLAIPKSALLATTYQPELARICGVSIPHTIQLNPSFWFRFCPECVSQDRMLQRTLTLAHMNNCPKHQIALVRTCQCGMHQTLFSRKAQPFTCPACGMRWAQFPRSPALQKHIVMEQKILLWYKIFFTQGTPTLLASVVTLIGRKFRERNKLGRISRLSGKTIKAEFFSPYYRTNFSLAYLVDLLVSLDLSPNDLI
jgi:hypothetical protein